MAGLQSQKNTLHNEVKQAQNNVKAEQDKLAIEKSKVSAEQKNFKDMQLKFQPRKDDLDRINRISQESKPTVLGNKICVTKEDWDFIINIATNMLKRCQSLYLAVATEVAASGYSDISKQYNFAKKIRGYNQTNVASQKAEKKTQGYDR